MPGDPRSYSIRPDGQYIDDTTGEVLPREVVTSAAPPTPIRPAPPSDFQGMSLEELKKIQQDIGSHLAKMQEARNPVIYVDLNQGESQLADAPPPQNQVTVGEVQMPPSGLQAGIGEVQMPPSGLQAGIGEVQMPPQNQVSVGDVQMPPQNQVSVGDVQMPPQNQVSVGDVQMPPQNQVALGDVQMPQDAPAPRHIQMEPLEIDLQRPKKRRRPSKSTPMKGAALAALRTRGILSEDNKVKKELTKRQMKQMGFTRAEKRLYNKMRVKNQISSRKARRREKRFSDISKGMNSALEDLDE